MSQAVSQKYESVIGLEVHVQLGTQTKMFCSCSNIFGLDPNSQTCPVCLGLPGSLPVINKEAVTYAIRIGLALNCGFSPIIKFDRKHYFYPDCPKNFQISQFDFPICKEGFIEISDEEGNVKRIRINRAHLEEDAGKLIHEDGHSLVDYNRTGTPLLEIVTEPDLKSPQEAYDYLNTLKHTISYLDVSDCDMEKGSLRCDANVSIRPIGETKLGTKTELKNMNSFRAVKAGLEYEIQRQIQMVEAGEKITQETLLWDESKQRTIAMRSKEEAHDYRYFPEPDLVPTEINSDQINQIKELMPELPQEKFQRFVEKYNLSEYDARILVQERSLADFFEECAALYKDTKKICNWINGSLLKELNERKISVSDAKINPSHLVSIIKNVEENTISNLAGKDVLAEIVESGKDVDQVIEEKGLKQVSDDSALEEIINGIIAENDAIVAQIKEGKESAIGFLVGQGMKKSQGKANPKKLGEILKRRILDA